MHWDGERVLVVLLSQNAAEHRAIRIVPAAAIDLHGIAVEIALGQAEGLTEEAVLRIALPQPDRIMCQWLVTLGQVDLAERVGALSSAKLAELEAALRLGGLEA